MNFNFGWGPRSKKETTSISRRRSHARERPRSTREDTDDSESWSDIDRNKRRNSSRRRSQRRSSADDKDHKRKEKSRTRVDGQRTTSSNYHSSTSSGKSRHRPDLRRSMTETRGSSDARRGFSESKSSLPYPSFSKTHSKENPSSRENLSRTSPYTPEHTDVGEQPSPRRTTAARGSRQNSGVPPPSPPLTAAGSSRSNLRRPKSASSVRRDPAISPVKDAFHSDREPSKTSEPPSPTKHLHTLRAAEEGASSTSTSPWSSGSVKVPGVVPEPVKRPEATSARTPTNTSPTRKTWTTTLRASPRQSALSGSEATSTTATRKTVDGKTTVQFKRLASRSNPGPLSPHARLSPSRRRESPKRDSGTATPVIEVVTGEASPSNDYGIDLDADPFSAAPPPPPPPLSAGPAEIPQVDYLLQHGGLPQQITRQFTLAQKPPCPQTFSQWPPPQTNALPFIDVSAIFAPYANLLESYQTVMDRHGSLAVATGYKSVARRLLDRLETVFARNISSEYCSCLLCKKERESDNEAQDDKNVSWGEVLELVSGRRELPPWPPFTVPTSSATANTAGLGFDKPMQKLDGDIPEEYRDHYIRQSKKTKQSVDKWLASQPEDQAAPPTELDDETLMFTMLTYLESKEDRDNLIALLHDLPSPTSTAPSPPGPTPDLMHKTATALKRLYSLPSAPRFPECAMYLLTNTHLHCALVTLAAISAQEWEILISGRFDGFLVSGAESQFPSMGHIPSRGPTPFARGGPSRGTTPWRSAAPSRGPVPASRTATPGNGLYMNGNSNGNGDSGTHFPAPVQHDEETEIAILGEVEREIYAGMERLEDALEALHLKAENVRSALIERSAGLSLQAQQRRPSGAEELRAVMGTPYQGLESPEPWSGGSPGTPWGFRAGSAGGLRALGGNGFGGHGGMEWGNEDDGMDDAASLAPDDSASNVGFRERRRKHRHRSGREKEKERAARKTPAPVEEEDEGGSEG